MSDLDKFKKDICIAAGHEWKKDPNLFADICSRCGDVISWMDSYRIAKAMAAPLKVNLEYKTIGGQIIKIETSDTLPIYDKDLPDQEI